MAFPISPTIGQEYTIGTQTYEWNGTAWDIAGSTTASAISDKADITYVNSKPTGFKNYIINGGFDVWQRGTSFTGLGAANNYTADRFVAITYGTNGTVNVTKVSSVTISTPLLRFETVNNDGLGAYYIEQRVENPSQFKNKTMTFSAKVRNVSGYSGKNIEIKIYLLTTTGYVHINTSLATLSLTNEFQTISGTHTFDNMSSYVFDESSYLLFRLELEDNNINGTIDITQVQLEEGSVATPFEQRPYGLELSLCQRYYQEFGRTSTSFFGFGSVRSTTQINGNCNLIVPMRTAPTVSGSASGNVRAGHAGIDKEFLASSCTFMSFDGLNFRININGSSIPFSEGDGVNIQTSTAGYIMCDAEL